MAVFDDPDHHYLTTATFFRRFPLKLAEPRGSSWPLARFGNGSPALVENHFGTGIVDPRRVSGHGEVDEPAAEARVRAARAPAGQLRHAGARPGGPLDGPADGAAEIAVAGTWAPASAKVVDPRGATTPVALERSASRLMGQFDGTTAKGYYTVEARGGRLEPPQAAGAAFAVNTAAEESNFQTVTEDQVRRWLPTADLTFVSASSEAEQTHGSLGEQREIWRPLIFLLFALIGVEFLLATMSSHAPTEEHAAVAGERGSAT